VRSAGGKNVNPYVGSEIDITLKFPNKIDSFQIAYSYFFLAPTLPMPERQALI